MLVINPLDTWQQEWALHPDSFQGVSGMYQVLEES